MPGQIPLDTRYYPNDFQVFSYHLNGAIASDPTIAMLLYVDRAIVIDSVVVLFGDGPNSAISLRIAYVEGLTQPTFTTSNTSGNTINITTSASTPANNDPASGGPTLRLVTGDGSGFDLIKSAGTPISNVIPRGSTIWLTGSVSIAGIERGLIQIRYRSQF
jgi:hypothetical protein